MFGPIKPLGLIVGLVGNGLLAGAMFHLLQLGDCGGPGAPPCSDAQGWWILAVPLGIILSVISVFLGSGIVGFCGTFLAVGVGALGAGFSGKDEELRLFSWIFGGCFLVAGVAPLTFAALGGRAMKAEAAQAERLVATGDRGVGTLVEVRDTGITINDNPRVELVMSIRPERGGVPVERRKTVTVSRVAVPRAGERYPVWYDPADPKAWIFGTDVEATAPAEVRALFAAADAVPSEAEEIDPLKEIARLAELRRDGAITEQEYEEAKDRLLAQVGR